MAGIFPDSGVACTGIQNAACGIETVGTPEECAPLYYNQRCNVQVSPLQINALISEIANAVNLTDPYDCSKLNNLKTTLATIQNLCTQPDQPAVDFDDYVAGCFDGVSGKINVSLLANLILAEVKTLCELPLVTTAADTDSLAGCFAGQDRRITIGNLKSLIGGAPALIMGGRFAQSSGSPLRQDINVGSRQQMIVQGSITQSTSTGYSGRLGEFQFNWAQVTQGGTSNELIWYPPQSQQFNYGMGGQSMPCYRIRESWYIVNNGIAFFIGSGNTLTAQGTVYFHDATILA